MGIWYGHGTPMVHLWHGCGPLKSGLQYHGRPIQEATVTHETLTVAHVMLLAFAIDTAISVLPPDVPVEMFKPRHQLSLTCATCD